MSKAAAFVMGTVLGLAMASPAIAQGYSPPGGVITPETRNRVGGAAFEQGTRTHQADGRATGAEGAAMIAECIARRGGSKAGSYLGGTLTGDPDYARIEAALTGRFSRCTDISAVATASAISAALAEQLVLDQAPVLADRADAVAESDARGFFGELAGSVTLDSIAGCLAVYSPGLAYKVLQTGPGSSEEGAALAAVYAQTPECGMQSVPSAVPPEAQRGALATALYAWVNRSA